MKNTVFILASVYLTVLIGQEAAVVEGLVVETAFGPVQGGIKISQAGVDYNSFEGIPYAWPPVGELRFSAPKAPQPWTGVLDVSGTRDVKCIQYGYMSDGGVPTVSGSEDCLYLNVWAPVNKTNLPVMMWIYGGSLTAGSNRYFEYGPMRFIDQDVIIVSPNYRLGPFGFTSLGIEEAPGNQGFLDLVASLEWINTNIEAFGGDPGRVTIFGESSGSWAVSYLTVSPLANGLFQRAIMQSGSLFSPYWLWQTQKDAIDMSNVLTYYLNCTTPEEDPYAALDCLREMPIDVLESTSNWGSDETFQIQKVLRPTGVIDGYFLPDNPVKLMESGEYNHVDLMVGMTSDEGLLQLYFLEQKPELYGLVQLAYSSFCPMFLFGRAAAVFTFEEEREWCEEFTSYYIGSGSNFNSQHIKNTTDMISDAYIYYGSHKQVEWAVQNGDNVYQYVFSFKGTYGFADSFGLDNSLYGVCHADELYYFWQPYWNKLNIQMTPAEELVSKRMIQAWTNFAKTGNPSDAEIPWAPVLPDNHQYLNIGEELTMEMAPEYMERMSVWDNVFRFPEGNTFPPSTTQRKDIIKTFPSSNNRMANKGFH